MQKKSADIIIKNGIILTIDKQKRILENSAIVIQNSEIIDIGNIDRIESRYDASQIIDAIDKIVLPGFVNTHSHMAMTIFRGISDDVELFDWLYKYIFPAEQKFVTRETVELGTRLAIAECIQNGITCFNDMYYFQEVTGQVAKQMGIRSCISEGIIDFPVANSENPEVGLENTMHLFELFKDDELVKVVVAAHAPYTCSEKVITKSKELARKYNSLFHIHLSETKNEFDSFIDKYKLTPTQYLDKLQVIDEYTIAAHCVWLSQADKLMLANKQVGIAHNPECNMKISSGISPIAELIDLKAKVGLGTDGVASNNNLNFIEEMRTMALLQKVATHNPRVLPAEKVIEIATIGGARVLHLDEKIGSIEIGKKADIITLNTNTPQTSPIYNPYSAIVYSMNGSEVCDTIVNGKILMKDRKILNLDLDYVMKQVRELAKQIKKSFDTKI